jgi:glycosyltransferase involved in cell wall biosynthesis
MVKTMVLINQAQLLTDLPAAPADKIGWPWTEASSPLPKHRPDGSEWPKISIVTPSYNQGQFIEETIRSVLLQGYPNLEYIIIDGGSTDNTVQIIQKYAPWITYWVSEKDQGQSHALNKGFQKATGKIIGWQNSDDFYHPNVFGSAAHALAEFKDIAVFYGAVHNVDEHSHPVKTDHELKEIQGPADFLPWPIVANQSSFFNTTVLEEQLHVDESLHFTMDYELFLRLAIEGYQFKLQPDLQAYGRIHSNAKGSAQSASFIPEFFQRYKSVYLKFSNVQEIREKAWECMCLNIINAFVNFRFIEFRNAFHELTLISRFRSLRSKLFLFYLISFLGEGNIRRLKRMSATSSSLKLFRSFLTESN